MSGIIYYKRPEILDRIPKNRHTVIEASAGTGKTYTIEHLFVELLMTQNITIDSILVLTYTERAAGELRSRIRTMIEKVLSTEPMLEKPSEICWEIDAEKRIHLERALFSFDMAPIHTIHSFFQRVVSEHAFNSGHLFEQSIIDSKSAFQDAFLIALRKELSCSDAYAPYLHTWLASGKSLDDLRDNLYVCHSLNRLILPHFDETVLRREFSQLAALVSSDDFFEKLEIDAKKNKLKGNVIKALVVRAERLRELFSKAKSLPELIIGYDKDCAQYTLAKMLCGSASDALVSSYIKSLTNLQQVIVSFKSAVVQLFLPVVRERLDVLKRSAGLYDYDDMIKHLLDAIQDSKRDALIGALRSRYRYALIDESQDTDERQWKIFEQVFVYSDSRNILYLVGDPKQAIYGFRGADVYTYLSARTLLCAHESPVTLPTNYRSTAAMIRAFNTIFSQACETPFFQGKITYGQPLQCGNPDYCVTDRSGREIDPVVVWELGTDVKTVHAHYYLTALGSAIASEISVLLSGSIPGLKPSDIFILTRKESEGRQIARFLRNAGLPFAFYKLNGLFQTPQAEHIRDILLAVQNPFDESKRMRAWMTPFFDVPIDQLSACKNLSENDPLVRNLFDWHVLARRRDFPALFSSIIKDSGLIRRIIFYQESERELTDYLHIFEMLLETAEEEGMELADLNQTLSDYMKDVRQPGREDGTIQRLETDKDAIQIMTMHKSKGLEAMVIFLYGGYGAAPPTDFLLYHEQDGKAVINFNGNEEHCQHARQESDDEDRRLLYVAVTRAKARLYLPFVPPEKYSRRVGMYRLLNDRLAELLGDEAALSKNGIVRQGLPAENTVTVRDDYNLGAFFSEKIDHITHLIDENIESQQFAELRTERAGFEITSYSRIKTLQAEHSAIEIEDGRILADRVAESTKTSLLSDMPSGLRFGNAFHLVMEKVNFSTIQQAKLIPAQWEVPDDLQELALYALSQEGFSHEHAPYLITLVYQALLSPVLLDDNKVPSRLTDVSVLSRELEFLYPYPGHQPLIDTVSFGKDVSTGEGFIKGFIDMVFRNQEKVFFCDWKTDIVHDYSSEYLLDYFQQHYALQANLYLGAICRMLQIRTEAAYEKQIGTAVYCFVRGMHPEYINRGVAIFRPSWRQLKNFEQELEHELHFAGRHQ